MSAKSNPLIEQLFRQHYAKLFTYAFAILKNRELTEDVIQETFYTAVTKAHILETHENPFGWLYTTLKYKIRIEIRTKNRYQLRFVPLEPYHHQIPDNSIPLDSMIQNEDLTLEKLKSILKPDDFHILKRLYLDEATHLSVASELGITVPTLYKRKERIRKYLKKHL